MRAGTRAIRALACAAIVAAGLPARAQEPAPACEVPAYLLATESQLPHVAEALREGRALDILVVGSRSSVLAGADMSYPARLQASLRERLPGLAINVTVELRLKATADEVSRQLGKLVEQRKPGLVVWQTGTFDAISSVDPDEFRTALDEGVSAVQKAGADAILMNLQYSPRTESMMSSSPYLDAMRLVAQEHEIPLFDRFAIMRHWNDSGDFDLFSPAASAVEGMTLARQVHACLGRALAALVVEAARINPAELRIQR